MVWLASSAPNPALAQRMYSTDVLRDTFGYSDETQRSVELADLHQGCPQRDCIPSIDEPKFATADSADHVADDDLVLALTHQGQSRAYPTRILDQHEIVNDLIAGTPIAVTYCPLCGSGVAILRTVDGKVTEFGVSGLLYNSDLVFYDRATETLWDQIEAKGIVGPLTGRQLDLVPLTVTRWGQWRAEHPDTLVLSTETGFDKDYTRDPYERYRTQDRLMFPVSATDDRVRPKTVVYGFDLDGQVVAFTHDLLEKNKTFRHKLNSGVAVTVTMNEDGTAHLTDDESGESYSPLRLYWFAWYTFHPETELVH